MTGDILLPVAAVRRARARHNQAAGSDGLGRWHNSHEIGRANEGARDVYKGEGRGASRDRGGSKQRIRE